MRRMPVASGQFSERARKGDFPNDSRTSGNSFERGCARPQAGQAAACRILSKTKVGKCAAIRKVTHKHMRGYPVEPNPPSPLAVASADTSPRTSAGCTTASKITCAIRSPGRTSNGSPELLTRSTL